MPWPSGLPPAAAERVRRQRASGLSGSLLSAPAAAALRTVGLAPVGEVMGAIVANIAWAGYGCGYGYGYAGGGGWGAGRAPVLVSGGVSGRAGYGYAPLAQAFQHGWDTALDRMLREAAALGADGVVGVSLREDRMDASAREFLALGTAVRHVDPVPAARRPFCTEVTAEEVASLRLAGWAPGSIVIGLSVAVRHDDFSVRGGPFGGMPMGWNGEVDGLTELMTAARAQAREELRGQAQRLGGSQVAVSSISTSEHRLEIAEGHSDHLVIARLIATTLHRQDPPAEAGRAAAPLTVLPLSDRTAQTTARSMSSGGLP